MTTLNIYRNGQTVQATADEVAGARQALGAAAEEHTHTGLMTQAQADKLAGLPEFTQAGAALATAADEQEQRTALGLGPLAVMTLPEAQAAVLGDADRTIRVGGAFSRRSGAMTEAGSDTTTVLMMSDVKRIPANISGFRVGFEFISTITPPPMTLAKYAICGVAGNDAAASMDAAASFHTSNPQQITFGAQAGFTPLARRSIKRPAPIIWSDFVPCEAQAGQTLVTRFLFPFAYNWRYSYCPHGIALRANYLSRVINPEMFNTVGADWVTGNNSWGINSTNMQVGSCTPYIEWFFTDDTTVASVWSFGDSTTTGTTGTGSTDSAIAPVIQACQQLSAGTGKIVIPVNGGVGGTTTWDSYYRLEDMLADVKVRPSAVVWLVGSQNNNSTTTTNTIAKGLLLRVEQLCASYGIKLILQTQIPLNGATLAIDNARKGLNDFARAICAAGRATLADWDAVVTDGGSPAAYQPAYGALSHPIEAAYNTFASGGLKTAIRTALGI